MAPEITNSENTKSSEGHDYITMNNKNNGNFDDADWKKENENMLETNKALIYNENRKNDEDKDCVYDSLLDKSDAKKDPKDMRYINGNGFKMHELAKPCLSDDSCKGLVEPVRVLVGPRGEILTREDTVVAGCATCSGGRLISCARIRCTSALCWQQTSKKPSNLVIGGLIFITLLSFIGTVMLCFTNVFSNTMLSNMVIKNNTRAHELWKNPPVHPLLKVHVFNYTNADEIMSGKEKKFKVEDLGPFTYRETIHHVNEVFHPNGTITYQDKRSYQFVPGESVGAQFDKVFVPNLPLLSAMSMARESYFLAQMGLSTVFTTLRSTAFRVLPLHRFLWGYDDNLISLAKPFLQLRGEMPYDRFGLLVSKNGTSPNKVTFNTGEKDLNLMGIIESVNGKNKLQHWGTDECNRVDATDGSVFPPSMLDRKQTLYVYNYDLCRRFPFTYEKDVEVFNGIPALRYGPPKMVFDNPSTYYPNQCYCHIDSGTCPPKGLFNSSPCAFGAPAFASFPHFYLGDPELLNTMEGLHPDEEKHSTYMDIHPTLGIPLSASSKIQINMQIRKSPGITGFDFLEDNLYLPVAWLEVVVTDLPQELRTIVYHATFSAHQVQLIMMWICVITFIVSGIFTIVALRAKLS